MNPNGFVLAARITSHTSMFIRSHNSAISFTSAMFTLRKMFSSSFVISAARALDTISTGAPMRFNSSAARCVARSFTPPTTLGVLIALNFVLPGSIRSGLKARSKSTSSFKPDRSRIGSTISSVVPGYVVLCSTTRCPCCKCGTMPSAALMMNDRSGALAASYGVGTQMKIASASRTTA